MRSGLNFNFDGLMDKINKLEKKASKELLDNALDKGAEVLLKEQLKTVPVDSHELEKTLDKGKRSGTGANRSIKVGIINGSKEVHAYGYYQEYGTIHINGKKWMKKAFKNSLKEARKAIADSIVKDLKE